MLSERYGALVACLRAVGKTADLSNLQKRIELQKRVYFLQEFGANLGYSYGWYVYGPYSTDLTRDAYAGQGLESLLPELTLNGASLTAIERFGSFSTKVQEAEEPGKDEVYWLELLSSLHFLASKAAMNPRTKEACIFVLTKLKPKFGSADAEKGWGILAEFQLVNP